MPMRQLAPLLALALISVAVGSSGAWAAPPTADPAVTRLSKLSGQAFDVAFLQALIPMDDESIEIAMAATLNADHPTLLQWNQTFAEQARAQVRRMLALLQDAGAAPAQRNEGVVTPSVQRMRTLRGVALEKVYLPLMAARLDQGVALARLAVQKGTRPAVRSFASEVVRVDGQESATLRGWLRQWYAEAALLMPH
jgi:uncharacterized protein (DUF305 family)